MYKNIKNTFLLLAVIMLSVINTYAQCFNGDLEANNFTNWTCFSGKNIQGVVDWTQMIQGVNPGRHTIVTTGNDPILAGLGVTMPMVAEGARALRLNNGGASQQADMAAYTFQVTSGNFSFRYAMVLQAPFDQAHTSNNNRDASFFRYVILKGAVPPNMKVAAPMGKKIKEGEFKANKNSPFLQGINGSDVMYRRWQTECIDLSNYVGQTVTIYFTAAACAIGAHFGYVYIDGLCKTNIPVADFTYTPVICANDALSVNGSASQNVTDYYWKIEKLSANSLAAVIPGTAYYDYHYGETPGSVPNLLANHKFAMAMPGNGYYKLTLGVKNCFSGWVEKSVIVEVRFPKLSVVERVYKCCTDPSPVLTGQVEFDPGVVASGAFNWFDADNVLLGGGTVTTEGGGGLVIYRNSFTAPSPFNAKYLVKFIDANGCKNSKYVYVLNKPPFVASISTNFCVQNCGTSATELTANAAFSPNDYCGPKFDQELYDMTTDISTLTYSWSTGETTRTIPVHPGINVYSVTISNGCFTYTTSFDLTTLQHPSGDILLSSTNIPGRIFVPTGLTPSTGNYFTLYEWGKPAGVRPAYNATSFTLEVFNRWGQRVYKQSDVIPCNGYWNGQISWDGAFRGNHKHAEDSNVFFWQLTIGNCTHNRFYKGDITLIQ